MSSVTDPANDDEAVRRERVHAQWQRLGKAPGTHSILDMARDISAAAGVIHPLVRALCLEDVYVCPAADGSVPFSVAQDDTRFVHVFSSPLRLAASLSADADELELTAMPLPQVLGTLPPGTGARLDPDSEVEVVLDPSRIELLQWTAAGVPTPAAMTPVDGESLTFLTGPGEETDLDRLVLDAVPGRVQRFVLDLDGVGGRTWPVYVLDGAPGHPAEILGAVQRAAGVPVVVVVNGEPAWLAEVVGPGVGEACRLRG